MNDKIAKSVRAKPTSGQARSNAANTTPHPGFAGTRLGNAFSGVDKGAAPSTYLGLTPHRFLFSPCGPATFLSPSPEKSPNREGKQSVKFIDGLTNLAALHAGSVSERGADAALSRAKAAFYARS